MVGHHRVIVNASVVPDVEELDLRDEDPVLFIAYYGLEDLRRQRLDQRLDIVCLVDALF